MPWIGLVLLGTQLVCFGVSLWVHHRSWRYRADALALLEQSAQTRAETALLLAQVEKEVAEQRGEAAPPLQ